MKKKINQSDVRRALYGQTTITCAATGGFGRADILQTCEGRGVVLIKFGAETVFIFLGNLILPNERRVCVCVCVCIRGEGEKHSDEKEG